MSKNILLIQFSSRANGNCAAIARCITGHYTLEKVNTFIIDDSVVQACNGCDYECLQPNKMCPNLSDTYTKTMDAICDADLAYFIIPNYCGYPSANYFVFNERSVGYFNLDRTLMNKYMNVPKRFIVVSNTVGQNFENAMRQQVNGDPEILYLKTSKYNKRSIAGDMMDTPEANADLIAFLKNDSF